MSSLKINEFLINLAVTPMKTTLNINLIFLIDETQMSGLTPVLTQARKRLEIQNVINALDHVY